MLVLLRLRDKVIGAVLRVQVTFGVLLVKEIVRRGLLMKINNLAGTHD